MKIYLKYLFLFAAILVLVSRCDESLPTYQMPQNTLALTRVLAGQGTVGEGSIVLNILIKGENLYDEVFQDTVNIEGNVKIWWVRNPEFEANLPINNTQFIPPTPIHGRVMTLAPGGTFSLQLAWFLMLDDGRYLPEYLEYGNTDSNGIQHARPETLRIEVEMTLFQNLGLLQAEPVDFVLNGWRKVNDIR